MYESNVKFIKRNMIYGLTTMSFFSVFFFNLMKTRRVIYVNFSITNRLKTLTIAKSLYMLLEINRHVHSTQTGKNLIPGKTGYDRIQSEAADSLQSN